MFHPVRARNGVTIEYHDGKQRHRIWATLEEQAEGVRRAEVEHTGETFACGAQALPSASRVTASPCVSKRSAVTAEASNRTAKEGITLGKHCPLKFNANTIDCNGDMLTQANRCEGYDCTWWIERTKECAVKLIAVESSNLIALKLGNREVMQPH